MSRKVVGITCGIAAVRDEQRPQYVTNRAYVRAIEQAGGLPLILPIVEETGLLGRYLGLIDGLLLTGGPDVGPAIYGEEPHPKLGRVDADRDLFELPLIRAAVAQDVPVFGICRGIQSLNVALGGTLFQDLPAQLPSTIQHEQSDAGIPRSQTSHSVEIEADSRLAEIVGGQQMMINSLHHQALKKVAEGLIVMARAEDGVVEAVEDPDRHFLLAVQFHPEETATHDAKSRKLFEAFVEAL